MAVLLALAIAGAAHAGIDNAGTTAANFLLAGSGGAPLGMGGATLGLPGDLASAAWNPAALRSLTQPEYSFSHAGLADDSRQEWVSAGGPFGASPWRWAASGLFVNSGSIEGRDALNNPTGSFSATSSAFGLSLARGFGDHASAGLTVRYVNDHLGSATGSGVTLDGGLLFTGGLFGLGFGAQNAIGQMNYSGTGYSFPTNYGAGISFQHPSGIRAAVDVNVPKAYYSDVRAGVEYRWHDQVALRTGYRRELGSDPATEALTGPSFGLGMGSRGLWFDYAFLPSTTGQSEQRVAISFTPSRSTVGTPFGLTDKPATPLVGPPAPKR
jgi:hypothetical protein